MANIINMAAEPSPRLLIVDDSDDNRYTLRHRLIREGYTNIVEAEDGLAAMTIMNTLSIDLVLLDVLMPEIDGFEVLERMRASSDLCEIPVIMISAQDEVENVVRCIEAGADDYFRKPFNAVLLRARVKASLEKKRLRDETRQQQDVIRQVFGRYVPEGVASEIVSGQGNLEPVQAFATILYTDIADFTRISESMRPDQIANMLNDYFEAVIPSITRFGGVVNQFQGDAMLVTFNVPTEDSKHADNAVLTAMEIQQIVEARQFAGIQLKTRIGINSGRIFAGNIGAGDRFNYTVHGDAVNLAARLEQLNKQTNSSVLISDSTYQLLTDSYPFESLGQMDIRGKSSRLQVYRLANVKKQLKQISA